MRAKRLQPCLTLCDPMDCSPPGSSVHGDSPGKTAGEGRHDPPPGDLPDPGMEPASLMPPALASSLPPAPPGKSGILLASRNQQL